jgi:hypothetical protein
MNNLDRRFTKLSKRLPRWLSRWFPYLANKRISREAIQQVVLMLSDQQLITGASILIIGYIKHCTITQYHFDIIALLGWISFTSHQSTLMILQEYLAPRPSMRHWRAIWISGLFGMIGVALIVTFNNNFLHTYGMSTQCVCNNMRGNYSKQWLVWLALYLFLLVWGYLAVMAMLFPDQIWWITTVSSMFQYVFKIPTRIRNKSRIRFVQEQALLADLSRHWTKSAPSIRTTYHLGATAISWSTWLIITSLTFLIFLLFFSISEIITIDLFRIYASLLWAAASLFSLKWSAVENGMDGSENDWGFGQLLPLLLLILPVFAAWEIIYGAQ